ncbi:MAG: inorganic diphosphatase [Campylobacterales bacterium]|nr:inorganic diphosphatase [Campylobacterales bacterium]
MGYKKVNSGKNPDELNAIIEIPYKSNIKYEIDEESGLVKVDRILYSAIYFPANYGFIPSTLSKDGDPADILVISEASFQAGSIVPCRLIGVLPMEDESGMDEKLIAVPLAKIDPTLAEIEDINDLPLALQNRIKNFFETYKMLEPNKWVKVKAFEGKEAAKALLEEALENYKKEI